MTMAEVMTHYQPLKKFHSFLFFPFDNVTVKSTTQTHDHTSVERRVVLKRVVSCSGFPTHYSIIDPFRQLCFQSIL